MDETQIDISEKTQIDISEKQDHPDSYDLRRAIFALAERTLKRDAARPSHLVDVIKFPGRDHYIIIARELSRARGYAYFTAQMAVSTDQTDASFFWGHYGIDLPSAVKDAYERADSE